jgi:hypothetical protein
MARQILHAAKIGNPRPPHEPDLEQFLTAQACGILYPTSPTVPRASSHPIKLAPGHCRSTSPNTGSAENKPSADSRTSADHRLTVDPTLLGEAAGHRPDVFRADRMPHLRRPAQDTNRHCLPSARLLSAISPEITSS